MTMTLTRFSVPAGTTADALRAGFQDVAPAFAEVPGLIRKVFLIAEDAREAGGSYLWETEEQARAFSEGPLRGMIREKFGVECSIEYFDAPVTVEGKGALEPAPLTD